MPGNLIKRAVDAFDGIIGWLTYFGYSYSVNNLRNFDEILRAASLLALDELKNLHQHLRALGMPSSLEHLPKDQHHGEGSSIGLRIMREGV